MTRASKSKLLYIISDDNYFLSHRLGLAKAAQADGYDVSVLAFENDTKFTDKIKSHGFDFIGFNQRAHGLGLIDNIKLIAQTRKVINQHRPDLIHTVSMRMMFLVTIAFWISKSKRMVATLTGMGYLETASNPMIRVVKWCVTKAFKMMFSSTLFVRLWWNMKRPFFDRRDVLFMIYIWFSMYIRPLLALPILLLFLHGVGGSAFAIGRAIFFIIGDIAINKIIFPFEVRGFPPDYLSTF